MLVRLTTAEGKDLWINPIHVKAIEPVRNGAKVYFVFTGSWAGNQGIKVQHDAATVADMLNAAMPDLPYLPPEDPPAPAPHAH